MWHSFLFLLQKFGDFETAANDAAARVAGVGGDREDRALLAAAAEEEEGDGGAVAGLDSASAAGDNPEVMLPLLQHQLSVRPYII